MKRSDNANLLANYVIMSFEGTNVPSEAQLKERMKGLLPALAAMGKYVSETEQEDVLRDLLARLRVSMDVGVSLSASDVKPWLAGRRASIDPFYWQRYKNYLQLSWPPPVIQTFDRVTDEILDLCGNPAIHEGWKRRGLVVGDVQSGKTATYTALCCKAADAGYQVIVLLAGSLESLRRQTQRRLDEGFAGLDSKEILPVVGNEPGKSRAVGAGLADQSRFAAVFTSRSKDFSKDVLNSRNLTLRSVKEPVLFVIKKHKSIIENLANWLKALNADAAGSIHESLLLIDDEADYASLNTNSKESKPTAINAAIRSLLAVFRRRTYIGFTATPFANVFIDPDTDDDNFYKEELFPQDFIYALEPPSNYIGASELFGEEVVTDQIKTIDDAQESFPPKHKSYLQVSHVPDSMLEALNAFCLANAIRDLRGEGATHRSMLVNVSQFTNVQDQVRDLLGNRLLTIKQHARNFAKLGNSEALRSDVLSSLHATYERLYSDCGQSWADIRSCLYEATAPIVVKSVNQREGAATLDYSKNADDGWRLIAVGGNSLSRGLTLEGLCTSYFYRSSQAYDTLLQMGRWFGYRPGYADLCCLWMTADAQQWYAHLALISEELRGELRRMKRLDMTPREFGLKVRTHPDTLLVTARNKMRTAETVTKRISWSGEAAETSKVWTRSNSANVKIVRDFLFSLRKNGYGPQESEWSTPIFRSVPGRFVADLLSSFDIHPLNFQLYTAEKDQSTFGLPRFIREAPDPKLALWDVAIPNGSLEAVDFLQTGISVRLSRRGVTTESDDRTILISGTKARVGSRGVEREGLPLDLVNRLTKEAKPKSLSDKMIREHRARPLLLLYAIVPFRNDDTRWTELIPDGDPLLGLGLSFPLFDDSKLEKTVTYKVNLIEWRNIFSAEEEEDPSDSDDSDD